MERCNEKLICYLITFKVSKTFSQVPGAQVNLRPTNKNLPPSEQLWWFIFHPKAEFELYTIKVAIYTNISVSKQHNLAKIVTK